MAKKLPNNIEVEQKILGGIIIDNNAFENVFKIIKPKHFFDWKHGKIFEAMVALNESDIPIDYISLYEFFKTNKIQISATDISSITSEVFTAANVEYHAKVVLDKYILREIIKTSEHLIEDASQSKDPADLLVGSIDRLEMINDYLGLTESEKDIVKDADNIFRSIREEQASENGSGYKSKIFETLNQATGGIMPGEYLVISGADKAGKTTFGLALLNDLIAAYDLPGAAFTYEMPYDQYTKKIISLITSTRYGYLRNPAEKDHSGKLRYDFHQLEETSGKFKQELKDKTYILIDEPMNELELKIKIKYLHRKYGVKIVLVDYIGLVQPDVKKERKDLEVASVSRMLKLIAQELKIVVIALSQENDEKHCAAIAIFG